MRGSNIRAGDYNMLLEYPMNMDNSSSYLKTCVSLSITQNGPPLMFEVWAPCVNSMRKPCKISLHMLPKKA